jgi:NAD(P)-dependent dehydrogenase (short-subunit alcohol dehydrogenase family)
MHPLCNKAVLITGGSSGIGRATGVRLAKLGAHVSLASRNRDALEAAAAEIGPDAPRPLIVPTDVTDAEQCRLAVESTVSHFGRLDILICCAGLSMRSYFEGSSLEALERVMRVNFFGTFYATHFALPHVKRSRGSLVAVSSLTGKRGIPSYAMYGASKFAIQGLYESLHLELKPHGVHVGIVSPAFVDTPLRVNVIGADGKPWERPPDPPFRIWPVEKCVDRIIRLLVKRRREILLPWFTGPLIALDRFLGSWIGNWFLARKFPPECGS